MPDPIPAPTIQELLTAYVKSGTASISSADQDFIDSCAGEAAAMVERECGSYLASVPAEIIQRATIEVGSELYNRRSAPNGISQFTSADGGAIRVARDPMVAARPMLSPFLPGGFA